MRKLKITVMKVDFNEELCKEYGAPDDTTPAARDMGLTGHCDIMIVTAVEIVEEMLAERS